MEKINKNSFKKFLNKIDACKYEGTGRIRLDVSLALGMLGIARPYWRISDHLKGFENFGIEYQESEHLFIFKNFEHLQELREIAQEYFRELETKQPDTNVDSLQKSEDQFLEIVKNVIDERVNGILEKILNDSFPESSQTIENIFKSRDRRMTDLKLKEFFKKNGLEKCDKFYPKNITLHYEDLANILRVKPDFFKSDEGQLSVSYPSIFSCCMFGIHGFYEFSSFESLLKLRQIVQEYFEEQGQTND